METDQWTATHTEAKNSENHRLYFTGRKIYANEEKTFEVKGIEKKKKNQC